MEAKILLPKHFCEMEAIRYVASRYGTTPEKVLVHYLVQAGIVSPKDSVNDNYELEPNEMALFRDLGVEPDLIEIK